MAFNFGGIGTAFTDLGGAVGDFFASSGEAKSAKGYMEGAALAEQNSTFALESAKVQQFQVMRQAKQQIGTEEATVAGNGFQLSGSGADILRSSTQQAALGSALIGMQGRIQSQGYLEQANALTGEAESAKAASKGSAIGGVLGIVGAVASLF